MSWRQCVWGAFLFWSEYCMVGNIVYWAFIFFQCLLWQLPGKFHFIHLLVIYASACSGFLISRCSLLLVSRRLDTHYRAKEHGLFSIGTRPSTGFQPFDMNFRLFLLLLFLLTKLVRCAQAWCNCYSHCFSGPEIRQVRRHCIRFVKYLVSFVKSSWWCTKDHPS